MVIFTVLRVPESRAKVQEQEAQNCSSTVVPYPAPSTRGSCNGIKVTHQFTIQIEDVGEAREEEKQQEADAEELRPVPLQEKQKLSLARIEKTNKN
jgi:hypothetical protein